MGPFLNPWLFIPVCLRLSSLYTQSPLPSSAPANVQRQCRKYCAINAGTESKVVEFEVMNGHVACQTFHTGDRSLCPVTDLHLQVLLTVTTMCPQPYPKVVVTTPHMHPFPKKV